MSINLTALGLRIRNLRITKNLTQEALAEKTNTSRVFIGLIENGDRAPGLETFVALANALHASQGERIYNEAGRRRRRSGEKSKGVKKEWKEQSISV